MAHVQWLRALPQGRPSRQGFRHRCSDGGGTGRGSLGPFSLEAVGRFFSPSPLSPIMTNYRGHLKS